MAAPEKLQKYQILVSPDSKKTQGLQTGDIVRRQYFDGTNVIYSLMCVLDYGTEKQVSTEVVYDEEIQYNEDGTKQLDEQGNVVTEKVARTELVYDEDGNVILDSNGDPVYQVVTQDVSVDVPYFIGALLEGDAPKTSELLDFARITNLFNVSRSGAVYLTASDDESPYIDVIDSIGRNKSLSWPESLPTEAFEDAASQYLVKGSGLGISYDASVNDKYRVLSVTRQGTSSSSFEGLAQDFYELVANPNQVIISYRAKASKTVECPARLGYATDDTKRDAEWTEYITEEWQYFFRVATIQYSGRHLRTFRLDMSQLEKGEEIQISDFNIILLSSVANFGEASAMRVGKLDGIMDSVYGQLSGYGAYIQKLYVSQTAHISGTLTAGDENGFASTFYAGKICRNRLVNSIDLTFAHNIDIDNDTLINPTGMGNVYRSDATMTFTAQTQAWLNDNLGKRHCFSFWMYAKNPCSIGIQQNGKTVGAIQVASDQTHEWRRAHVYFDLIKPDDTSEDLMFSVIPDWKESIYDGNGEVIQIENSEDVLFFTAPQLESGEYCTQYQPTDDTLSDTDDYGAWFARGGIGGTIQNPLLRLNMKDIDEDGNEHQGSIGTRTGSFLLRTDGSGYLANKNIRWDSDGKVTFGSDVTLNWDNLDDGVKAEVQYCELKIGGTDTMTILQQEGYESLYYPETIELEATETGFSSTSSQRQWYYLAGGTWWEIKGANSLKFTVEPDGVYWNNEASATLKLVVTLANGKQYADTFTVRKQYTMGYSVNIVSSEGLTFHNSDCQTVLTAYVYYLGQKLDVDFAKVNFNYTWHRYSASDPTTELELDGATVGEANQLILDYPLTGDDIYVCEIEPAECFDYYNFPITIHDFQLFDFYTFGVTLS